MNAQVNLFLLLTVAPLLVKAQTPAENYGDFITGLFAKRHGDDRTFRPLLDQVQVHAMYPKDVDLSTMSVRSLTFPVQETLCDMEQGQQDKPCPPKTNGELSLCKVKVTHPIQEVSNILTWTLDCEPGRPDEALQQRIRTRRSKGGKKGRKPKTRTGSRSSTSHHG